MRARKRVYTVCSHASYTSAYDGRRGRVKKRDGRVGGRRSESGVAIGGVDDSERRIIKFSE